MDRPSTVYTKGSRMAYGKYYMIEVGGEMETIVTGEWPSHP